MAFCTPEELVAARAAGRAVQTYRDYGEDAYRRYGSVEYTGRVTLEVARRIIAMCKEATHAHCQSKINRPYYLVPSVTGNLDPNDDWIGWEIECGWADQKNYDMAVDYIWNEQNHVTIDIEGAGLPTEITWSPENGRTMYTGDAQVHRFLDWVSSSGVQPAIWSEHSGVGTHCNISTKLWREANEDTHTRVRSYVNAMLMALSPEHKLELFGRRQPYGYGYVQYGGPNSWVEFKLFNSTLDREQFDGYVRVAERLGRMLDAVISNDCVITVSEDHPVMQEITAALIERLKSLGHSNSGARATMEYQRRTSVLLASSGVYEFLTGQSDTFRAVVAPNFGFDEEQLRTLMAHAESLLND